MEQKKISAMSPGLVFSIGELTRILLDDCTKAWHLSRTAIIAIACLPFIIALSGVAAFFLGKPVYVWFTSEDGPIENIQVLFWALTLVFCIRIVLHLWKAGDKGFALLYGCLCVGIFFVIGEEISWGQRIFGWHTSVALQEMNRQGETNLHNLYSFGDIFKWGQLFIGAYGVLLPLLLLRSNFLVRYRKITTLVVPHYLLIPFFLVVFMWRVIHNLTPLTNSFSFSSNKYTEIIELVMVTGFFLFMVYQIKQFPPRRT